MTHDEIITIILVANAVILVCIPVLHELARRLGNRK